MIKLNYKTILLLIILLILFFISCGHQQLEKKTLDKKENFKNKSEEEEFEKLKEKKKEYEQQIKNLEEKIKILEQEGAPKEQIKSFLDELNKLNTKYETVLLELARFCSGYIYITSNPKEADIKINEKDKDSKTPRKFWLSCGSYEVEIKRENCKYQDNPRSVNITKKHTEDSPLKVNFEKKEEANSKK